MSETRAWEVARAPEGVQGKTIQDFLYFDGMYNPVLRFGFTNVTDDVFHSGWNSQPYKVQPHQTVKLPHHLARKFTEELVDALMKKDNKGMMIGVPAARKPYEDRILTILPSENSAELEIIKNDFLEEIKRDASRVEGEADAQSPASSLDLDFEDLSRKNFVEPKKPGRPKKAVA